MKLRPSLGVRRGARHSSVLVAVLAAATTLPAQAAEPDIGNEIGRVELVQIQSGPHDNLSELATLVWERRIRRPGASFLQLEFGNFELPEGSWVELTSMADMTAEVFDAETIARCQRMSSYFNGSDVRVRLFGGPLARDVSVSFVSLGVGHPQALLEPMTICGSSDNRVRSTDKRVSRIIIRYSDRTISWCTAWLIDPQNCFVTAGHCMDDKSSSVSLTAVTAQFNVPLSTSSGSLQHPSSSHQYVWLGRSSAYRRWQDQGPGQDWAVFKVGKNSVTDRYPGFVQGDYFRISTLLPSTNSTLRLTGHGGDSSPQAYRGVQQTHTGPYKGESSDRIRYRVDTEGGNSGSPVIKTVGSTEYAIGVHTHGGCGTSSSSTNSGTFTGKSLFASARTTICNSGLCDLEALSVGVSQTTLAPNAVFTVSSSIRNAGQIDVPETTTTSYYLSTNNIISTADSLLASFTTTKLGIGKSQFHSTSVKIPSSTTAGTRYVGVLADRIYKLPELDEGNNDAYRSVTVLGALGDLTPTFLSTSTTNLYPDLPFTMAGRVNNVGSATTASVTTSFLLSTNDIISTADTTLASWTTPSLAKGTSHYRSISVKAPSSLASATCHLGILTDRTGKQIELDEGNNTRSLKVTCHQTGRPDLIVTALAPSSTSLAGGGTVTVSTTTKNDGTAAAPLTSSTGLFLSTNSTISTADWYLGSHATTTLGIGKSQQIKSTQTIPACPTTGTYYLGAWADHTGRLSESNEGNNTRATAVRVTGTRATVVEWQPRRNTFALNETAASASSQAGGVGYMCVASGSRAGQFYLVTWGGNGKFGSGWSYGWLTDFSLSLTNGPIMPLWFGALDSGGRAAPRLVLPKGGPPLATFYAYTRVFFFAPKSFALTGYTTNTHYIRISK